MTLTTTLCLIVFALAAAFLVSRFFVKSAPEPEAELLRVTRKSRVNAKADTETTS